tara:strand:- start:260 stop:583 length:324 start_codon:yes stop_codon:yes gene_type:complete
MCKIIFLILFIFLPHSIFAESIVDQWKDSKKSYRELIDEGFDVKAYDSNSFKTPNGLTVMFFVTVLQKNKEVYECQEYQTLDETMNTINLSVLCKELTKPYQIGLGT